LGKIKPSFFKLGEEQIPV